LTEFVSHLVRGQEEKPDVSWPWVWPRVTCCDSLKWRQVCVNFHSLATHTLWGQHSHPGPFSKGLASSSWAHQLPKDDHKSPVTPVMEVQVSRKTSLPEFSWASDLPYVSLLDVPILWAVRQLKVTQTKVKFPISEPNDPHC
jgi:hypothetical protein